MSERPRRRGFTLIEMLVVISIIALLISLLLPALTQGKEVARMALCMSNLHQQSIAFNTYASEAGGMLPVHVISLDRAAIGFHDLVDRGYLQGGDIVTVNNMTTGTNFSALAPKVLECPVDANLKAVSQDIGTGSGLWNSGFRKTVTFLNGATEEIIVHCFPDYQQAVWNNQTVASGGAGKANGLLSYYNLNFADTFRSANWWGTAGTFAYAPPSGTAANSPGWAFAGGNESAAEQVRRKVHNITKPAGTWLSGDGSGYTEWGLVWPSWRHMGSGTFSYFDGHVEAIKPETVRASAGVDWWMAAKISAKQQRRWYFDKQGDPY